MITEYNRSVRCTKITGHTRDDSDVCSTIKHWGLIIVCFVVCDNGFPQIFYNCSNVEEIFSWHN